MTEISELERRITAALDRVSAAMEQMTPVGGGDAAALTDQLAEERTANAQLEARVQAIQERQETKVAALEEDVRRLKAAVARRESEVQAVRATNAALRENNAALRAAVSAQLPDEAAVTASLQAELAALSADRTAEKAELDEILASLTPILAGEAAHG